MPGKEHLASFLFSRMGRTAGQKGKAISREFRSYDEVKQYYEDMLRDPKRYVEFNKEIVKLERQLEQKIIPVTQERKEDIKYEIEVYTRARDEIWRTFPEKYKVYDIKKLSLKIREFEKGLSQMERGNQWEAVHATQQDGQSNQAQEQSRKAGHKELLDAMLKEQEQKDQDSDKDRGHER